MTCRVRWQRRAAAALICALGSLAPGLAAAAGTDAWADRIAFTPSLGATVARDVQLADEHAIERPLAEWLADRPALLVPVWYSCPNLCEVTTAGVAAALEHLDLEPAADFDVLVFSIDPNDDAASSVAARDRIHGTTRGWHLLHGQPQAIDRLTRSIGFRYFYDPERQEYAHAAGVIVLNQHGRMAGFLPGVRFDPSELERLIETAARDRVSPLTHRLLLTCYGFDPATGRYSLEIMKVARLLGLLAAAVLAVAVARWLWRERIAAQRLDQESRS